MNDRNTIDRKGLLRLFQRKRLAESDAHIIEVDDKIYILNEYVRNIIKSFPAKKVDPNGG